MMKKLNVCSTFWPVPLSVISSWKKIKAMGVTNQLLVTALRTSEKLVSQCCYLCSLQQLVAMHHIMKYFLQVVSDDGKKVRRAQPFTERHKEELQVSTSEQDKVSATEMETISASSASYTKTKLILMTHAVSDGHRREFAA